MSRQALAETPFYEDDERPDIMEMQCPIPDKLARTISCELEMDRNELAVHISQVHTNYNEDPEPWFDAERARRFK